MLWAAAALLWAQFRAECAAVADRLASYQWWVTGRNARGVNRHYPLTLPPATRPAA